MLFIFCEGDFFQNTHSCYVISCQWQLERKRGFQDPKEANEGSWSHLNTLASLTVIFALNAGRARDLHGSSPHAQETFTSEFRLLWPVCTCIFLRHKLPHLTTTTVCVTYSHGRSFFWGSEFSEFLKLEGELRKAHPICPHLIQTYSKCFWGYTQTIKIAVEVARFEAFYDNWRIKRWWQAL